MTDSSAAEPDGAAGSGASPGDDPAPRLQAVVGIGASAGGIAPLQAIFRELDPRTPACYLLLQHTTPSHLSNLCTLLAQHSPLTLQLAEDGQRLEPGHAYLLPTDRQCLISDDRLQLTPAGEGEMPGHSIDGLLAGIAEAFGQRAFGVLLSGTGIDGLQGMRAIRASGGVTLVQDPAGAEYPSMPQAVIDAQLADIVLPPAEIAAEIRRVVTLAGAPDAGEVAEDELGPLLRLVQRKTGFDFALYKEGTLQRRIARRMLVHGCKTLEDYRRLLMRVEDEPASLVRDLLISVTNFFRDGTGFEALRRLLRPVVEERAGKDGLRIWVPGCATGEEAYTIAIIVSELLGERLARTKVQIFATDIDAMAIQQARQAIYRDADLQAVPQPLRARYFEAWDGQYRVQRMLREWVIFAEHDLIHDPPFTRLDLVSCCNVLIYFRRPLQERLLGNFHYALRPQGLLLLGNSESAEWAGPMFERADDKAKIYRRVAAGSAGPHLPLPRSQTRVTTRKPLPPGEMSPEDELQRLLLHGWAPPCVLINARQEVVLVHGDVSAYLRLPQGRMNLGVVDLAADTQLRGELRLVVNRVLRQHERISTRQLPLADTSPPRQLQIHALPSQHEGALLLFVESASETVPAVAGDGDRDAAEVELERELAAARELLQANIEELEAANEELQSRNEEFQATSEEAQATLEEYQTTNEELQSTNEEMRTVNDELNVKSEALESANADMRDILENVASAIVVLDLDLRVTRYSKASRELFDLWPSSIGRPFPGAGGTLGLLSRDIHDAMRAREPLEREMTLGKRIFRVRLIPRVDDRRELAGLVIVFTDETEQKRAERRLENLIEHAPDAMLLVDRDGRITRLNRQAEQLFGYGRDELIGGQIETLVPEASREAHRALRAGYTAAPEARPMAQSRDLVGRCKDGSTVPVEINLSPIGTDDDLQIAVIVRDASWRRQAQHVEQAARKLAEQASQTKSRFLAAASHDLRQALQALTMYLAAARKEEDRQRRQDMLDRMERSLHSMRGLLNALLDLSRLDAGQVTSHPRVFPVQELLDRVGALVAPLAEAKGLALRRVPCTLAVNSDPALLEDLLINLAFNAVKHTSSGRVLIGCHRAAGRLRIGVCDTGPGIAPEHQETVFDEFVQLSEAQPQSEQRMGPGPGLGLGLSIVRRLGELLEHPVELRSQPGRGTCVWVSVPLAELAGGAAPRPAPARDEGAGGHLLLLDDNPQVLDSTRLLLELNGFSVDAAADGEEALRLARQRRPDLIVADFRLAEGETGLAMVHRLRQALAAPGLPAVLLTGENAPKLEEQATAAGCTLLLKPVLSEELLSTLRGLLAVRRDPGGPPA